MNTRTPHEILSVVNKAIDGLDLGGKPERLYDPIRYVLSIGGKRLRPVMCLMACDMFEGDIMTAVQPALALEVFHNFTLLHDDIMDKAEKRRNMDCVHIKWDDNVAILSGDAMQIYAYELIKNVPDNLLRACLSLFTKTALEVCEGQQFDMDFETQDEVTLAEYMKMIRLKTAVLVAASLKMGAILGGSTEKDADLIYEFGINTGIAFQLQDDLLDVYGETCTFGKNIGGDIVTNKKTFLLIKALQNADEESKNELVSWLNRKDFNPCEKIKAVTDIFNKTNVQTICQKEMENYLEKAVKSIESISVPDDRKKPLIKLAADLMNRKY
jgi:geranylgeranyl diphosphate synthase, type II